MLNVEDRLVEQLGDVRVVQGVEDVLALPLADHESQLTQRAQLMRDGRGFHLHGLRELTHGARPLLEATEDLHAARRREHLHPLGHRPRELAVDRRRRDVVIRSMAQENA